ncbi:hypothetical protein B0A80_18695 [Flavobacterium tructae]|uniref:Uncharacterized protein n=1 Tax=Flavobacterium tructae TaxID=1114873 RepID=A0A1S1JAW9_9FLAO|nr:hypothetical protein BHE19_04125 [Flavobacterium tructae]OXB20592.1 hypothetical protein B0A80_18695 [Flavobacterium tructae]OXB21010.1 hypothetical protein B0A71_05305 [Flavobacterium tructae]
MNLSNFKEERILSKINGIDFSGKALHNEKVMQTTIQKIKQNLCTFAPYKLWNLKENDRR